jgi:ABC-type transport system involved in multi-copper enzyme maturation permease subunit
MREAIASELFKTLRRRMTYIILGAMAVLVTMFYVILWLRLRQGPDPTVASQVRYESLRQGMSFENVVSYALELERFFATLLCVVFTATMMGNEYDWRTAGLVLSRGVRRRDFVAAKVLVSLGFIVVMVTFGFLVAMACSAWFTNLYHLSYGTFSVARAWNVVASIGRTSFVIVPLVLMSLLFATIWRSAGQAVGFSLGFFFLESIFTGLLDTASGFLGKIPEALLNVNAAAVMSANGAVQGDTGGGGPLGGGSSGGPSVLRGAAVLSAWLVVFLVVSFWRFERRDVQE